MARKSGEYVRRKSPVGSQELHVLAVDDSHVDRKVIERLLNISSCKVTLVESARRALQFLGLEGDKSSIGFDALKVNLIMTDYSMPGMTGYELLKKIKESSTLREIPVVIMSSENILARIDRCLEEGAEEFLVKPVKLSDVKRLTDFILNGEGKENSEMETDERKLVDDCAMGNGERENHKRKRLDDYIPSSTSPRLSSSSSLLVAPDQFSSQRPFPSPLTLQSCSKRQRL